MAAEKGPTAPHRGTDVGGEHLSIEEKYDEVRQLISIGKEKGYLLYDEVNELLPSEITSSDELDDLFNTFGSAGIEVIDSDQKYLRDDVKPIERGKLAVIKSISRTPLISKKVIELGDQLHTGERTIRELVIFNDEEITDERIVERDRQIQKQI